VTPEAATLETATGGATVPGIPVTTERLRAARDDLGRTTDERLGAVSVGTPPPSIAELERLLELLGSGRTTVPLYVNVGREQVAEAEDRGLVTALGSAGVRIVSDTRTYMSPGMERGDGPGTTD